MLVDYDQVSTQEASYVAQVPYKTHRRTTSEIWLEEPFLTSDKLKGKKYKMSSFPCTTSVLNSLLLLLLFD